MAMICGAPEHKTIEFPAGAPFTRSSLKTGPESHAAHCRRRISTFVSYGASLNQREARVFSSAPGVLRTTVEGATRAQRKRTTHARGTVDHAGGSGRPIIRY